MRTAPMRSSSLFSRRRARAGFTLIEAMIVAALIADLAVIAIPSFMRARKTTQNTRFCNELRVAVNAFEMYAAENNKYPAEVGAAVVPAGMTVYLDGLAWTRPNSMGGQWDWDFKLDSTTAAIATVSTNDFDSIQMARVDTLIDNGVTATGQFRRRDDKRYSMIIE